MGFQQTDRQYSQILNIDIFCRLPVTSAQCVIGTKKYPDAGIRLKYDHDDHSQGYAQITKVSKALSKDDIRQPYIYDDYFRSSNISFATIGYNICVFDKRYQQSFSASQPIKIELYFNGVVPNEINGYALVLTKKLVSVSSDGQRHFDLN